MNTLVVVPTYNERDNLPLLVPAVLAHPGFRMLVVDDGSPDGTGQIADSLAQQYPGRIEVMHRTGPARPRPLLRRWPQARAADRRDADLPDGCGPFAQSGISAVARGCSHGRIRRRHRFALPERRQRGELATAPDFSEHVREPLHQGGHRPVSQRLHQRLPVLAPGGIGEAAARSASCPMATPS